jgi:peptidoglycan/LPS O-acetylase OafA/YrhL
MATTKDHLDELEQVALEEVGVVAPAARPAPAATVVAPVARKPLRARLFVPIDGRSAVTAAVAWVVLLAVGIVVEPPPANPDAVDPWFVDAVGTLLISGLVLAFAGLWQRRRWSLAASLAAAGMLVLSTLMCPVSGHHAVGAWWVVQLGCALGLVAVSALGLRRTAPR